MQVQLKPGPSQLLGAFEMAKVLLLVTAAVGVLGGCSSMMPPTKTTGPAGLTSGQRQTDQSAFGHAAATDTRVAGLPTGSPDVAMFEARGPVSRGLLAAAWNDGTIVFASRVDAPGVDLRIGRTESARVARLIEGCISNGFGTAKPAGPVELPFRSLGVRLRGAPSRAQTWSLAARSEAAAALMGVCGPCGEELLAMIPLDGGKPVVGDPAWLSAMERFANTGVWAGDGVQK